MHSFRVIALVLGMLAVGAAVQAQPAQTARPPHDMHHMDAMQHGAAMAGPLPQQPGQAAFGAIQEIVGMLQADPHTDWSKVDIDSLRQHLIDMDEVTLRAVARKERLDDGLRIAVTGSGRTLEAIQRMLPEHARAIDGLHGWHVQTEPLADGVLLTVTAGDAADVQRIRALGFMGIMVLGLHQPHHLAMAKGEMHMH